MGLIPPWSELPTELLSAICQCLNSNPIDILSFRSVCKTWCSSCPPSSLSLSKLFPPFPLTIPPPPSSLRTRSYSPSNNAIITTATTVYALRPPISDELPLSMPRAWLVFVDQRNPGKVTIRQPFKQFPYSLPINFPKTLNFMSFHASELCRFYNISHVSIRDMRLPKSSVWFGLVRKVVVSFSNGYGLALVALSDDGKLGLLRLGSGDLNEGLGEQSQWELIHDGKGFRFDDIVDFKGRMLGIDRRGRVFEIEVGCSSAAMSVIVPSIAGGGGRRKRLVESLGCLHLMVQCNFLKETDARFKVFELNEETRRWVEVNSLGDHTFFVGLEFSFSASAEELHGSCGKNAILFSEGSFLTYSGPDDNSGLFRNLRSTDLHVGVWNFGNVAHLGVIGSYPGYSNVLWPPPSWIWPTDKCERLGSLLTTIDLLQMKIPNETLEAGFKEVSPHQQEGAITLMIQFLKIKELLQRTRVMNETMEAIRLLAVSLQQHSDFENLHNQVGVSSLGAEGRRVSVDSMQKAVKLRNCDFDWYFMEINLNACIFQYEEKINDLMNTLRLYRF